MEWGVNNLTSISTRTDCEGAPKEPPYSAGISQHLCLIKTQPDAPQTTAVP